MNGAPWCCYAENLRAAPEGPQLGHPRLDTALQSERDASRGSVGGLQLTRGSGCPDTASCCSPVKLLVDVTAIWNRLRNAVLVS